MLKGSSHLNATINDTAVNASWRIQVLEQLPRWEQRTEINFPDLLLEPFQKLEASLLLYTTFRRLTFRWFGRAHTFNNVTKMIKKNRQLY